ncbi:MAG: hypothetical protein JWR63_3396 [Conexibacter sp.]|nr:hypothetical protein [Conexibacter sp.]
MARRERWADGSTDVRAAAVRDRPDRLAFVQLEFTHALGPAAGRYVVANVAPDARFPTSDQAELDVLVLDVAAGATPILPRGMKRSRKPVDPTGPAPVPVFVATHVRAAGHGDAASVKAEVGECRDNAERQGQWIGEAIAVVNQAIRAHRAACGDPYFAEIMPGDPRAVRIGYGAPRDVGHAGWEYAFSATSSEPRLGYYEKTAPSEVVAAMLKGHRAVLDADELLLRGLLDLDQGRRDCAALQLHAAARLLARELRDEEVPEYVTGKVGEVGTMVEELEAITRQLPVADPDIGIEDVLQRLAYRVRYVLDARRIAILDARS